MGATAARPTWLRHTSRGLQRHARFSVNGGTAPRSDRRSCDSIFVETITVDNLSQRKNKNVPTIAINVMGNLKRQNQPLITVKANKVEGT
jgi:hypothetical protein